MKLNEDKCHLMIFGNKCKDSVVNIGNSTIKEGDYEKPLGVTFDKKLSFTKHVEDLCKKANQRLHALARLSNYTDPVNEIADGCIYQITVQLLSTRMDVP